MKKTKDLYQNVAVELLTTHSWYMHQLKTVLKPYDISPAQYNILRILKGAKDTPVSASFLKDQVIDKGSNITRLIDKMEIKKWVTRCLCLTNRRQMDIDITEEGIKILSDATKEINELIKVLYSITEEEAEIVSKILIKIRS
ncbi:MarR family transcriptional regulator [uncultured Aquimarina sp.]|uniref:MarR family winged helix-turn-helix transcriptional regulator n=1 Tax=uncultured Aquimarina sp. TaxID=575652 RepID=UPI00262B347A|nr:MarR family transcriptional regulator [uncultured Aquimarina sp.]